LGCGPAGAAEIKNHPFFAGLDWDKVGTPEREGRWEEGRERGRKGGRLSGV